MMYKMKKILTGALFALLTGLATISGTAVASTPDGVTPANEGVCDALQGGTGGLYGLCVAYCEAQDLDSVASGRMPNTKILANYRKKMQPGDLDMPCVQPSCPCWTDTQLSDIDAGGASCTNIIPTAITISGSALASADTVNNSCLYIGTTFTGQTISADQAQFCFTQIRDTASCTPDQNQ